MTGCRLGPVAVCVLALSGCNEPLEPVRPVAEVVRVIIEPVDTALFFEGRVAFRAVAFDSAGTPMPSVGFVWHSGDSTVVTIDSAGDAQAVGIGKVMVTVRADDVLATASVTVKPGFPVISVDVGLVHACAVDSSDVPYCWGYADGGRLGSLTAGVVTSPAPVAVATPLSTIDLGEEYGCGISTAGEALCWGTGIARMGTGLTGCCYGAFLPTPVAGDLRYSKVSLGPQHTCALGTDGEIYCWGSNAYGQLGRGEDTSLTTVPAPVALAGPWVDVSAGDHYTCAVHEGGMAYCWGGDDGQLGYQAAEVCTSYAKPCSTVPRSVDTALKFRTVAAGRHAGTFPVLGPYEPRAGYGIHTCGLLRDSSVAYCWGSNLRGQLGISVSITQSLTPVLAAGSLRFSELRVFDNQSCGLTDQGRVLCWGNVEGAAVTNPIAVAEGMQAFDLGLGFACGITSEGTAACWGDNAFGQLGNGSRQPASTPTLVLHPRLGSR